MFDFARRRQQLLRQVMELGVDGILVTDEINVRYLSGFSGDSSYLLLTPDHSFILSDSRYDTQIAEECPDLELITRTARKEMRESLHETVQAAGLNQLALETDSISKQVFDQMASIMSDVQWRATQQLVVTQRAIKDAEEIEIIRHSVRLAERAFLSARARLTASQTEQQTAWQMESVIRELGGEGRSFDMIVGVGARAALPHAGTTDVAIGQAPFVLFDWGANYRGYASDLTRMVVTGEVSDEFVKVYNTVLEAQEKAIAAIAPGVSMKAVDTIARQHIAEAGYGDYFGHGLGHGFGLQIHEQPRLSPTSEGVLEPGMVVTVEPGIYLPGNLGVRIEDDVLVTFDGHEVLSELPKCLEDNCVQLL